MSKNGPWHVDESKIWFKKESGWPEEVPKNLDFPVIPLGDMLKESVQKFGPQKAIWFLGKYMTYDELFRHVQGLATSLHKLGVKKGDVVTMLLPNSFQYIISYYACQLIGAVASGLNPTYKPMELLHQIKTTNATTLVCLDSLYEGSIAPIIGQSKINKVIGTNVADFLPVLKKTLGKLLKKIPTGPMPADTIPFKKLCDAAPAVPQVKIDPMTDAATYIMTGGTTGLPKAAELTHFNLTSNALQAAAWLYKITPGYCSVGVLPLFHSFAMTCVMNISIRIGAWMMLFPRPPETAELLETVAAIGPDNACMYPGAEILFKRIADLPDAEIERFNVKGKFSLCVSGAGPLHRPVQEAFEAKTGARLSEGFGLTECSPVVSAGQFWGNRKVGTIGLPFPGTEWRILDSDTGTKDLGVGQVGELCVAGPQVMKGYLNQPEETSDHLIQFEGKTYMRTGDIGVMDETGTVTIMDRKKQLIKFRGYSVFPKEVEELVGGHPAVSEVAASGIPDPEDGEIIKVWVSLKPDHRGKITEKELREWCKANMTHYKVPRLIEFRDEIPKTLVGKVMRRELQEADPLFIQRKKEMAAKK
jgi:long-chain acyl-CoA synthetase